MGVDKSEKFIIRGLPPHLPLPEISLGESVYHHLKHNTKKEYPAIIDAHTGKHITYLEILNQTCTLAECLKREGYGIDSVITISSENSLKFFVPVIAALYIGATVAPINHNYTILELRHTLTLSKPSVIFCSRDLEEKYVKLKDEFDFIKLIILIDGDNTSHSECMDKYMERVLHSRTLNEFVTTKVNVKDHVVFILCSSGTTGLAKGVMLTDLNILTYHVQMMDTRLFSINPNEVSIGIMPFFHSYGLNVVLGDLKKNQLVVMMTHFDPRLFLKIVQDCKITRLYLVPPLVTFLARSPLVDNYDLSSLREIISGAAPLSKEIEQAVKNRLNIKYVRQGYGLTETTLAVTVMGLDEPRFGSSGRPAVFLSVVIRDPKTGQFLGPHQVGEVCVKGPSVMKGYCGDPIATANSFTDDGWLLTGDLAYYDDDGYFYIVDRIKELIKYKGFQVAPAQLEMCLILHPGISDAGVVGVPDDLAGEIPLAFVVRAPKTNLSEKEIQEYVSSNLSPQNRLRGGVIFVDVIPRNQSGKILRRELRLMLKNHKSKL